jgi:hypothetical protein
MVRPDEPVGTTMVRRNSSSQKKFRQQALPLHPFCQWCQCPLTPQTATTDHLLPLSRGGRNVRGNLCLACFECNQGRRNDLPQKAPSGPCWGDGQPAPLTVVPAGPDWVAWTRYPGSRWRSTFRSARLKRLLKMLAKFMGECLELRILREGREPLPP